MRVDSLFWADTARWPRTCSFSSPGALHVLVHVLLAPDRDQLPDSDCSSTLICPADHSGLRLEYEPSLQGRPPSGVSGCSPDAAQFDQH